MKRTFITKEQIEKICKTFPTPFHLYDEAGIRGRGYAEVKGKDKVCQSIGRDWYSISPGRNSK